MSGVTVGFVIVAQYVFVGPKNPCRALEVEIAQAAHEVFLDPTDAKRAEMTKHVTETVLLAAARQEDIETCEAAQHIWSFTDDSWLPPGRQRGFSDTHPQRLSRGYRDSLARDARESCAADLRARSCTLSQLSFLVLLNDPLVSMLFRPATDPRSVLRSGWPQDSAIDYDLTSGHSRELEPVLEPFAESVESQASQDSTPVGSRPTDYPLATWIALRREFPQRSEFLRATLASADATIRRWALDDAAGDIDPRNWKPEDIAVLVLEARRADAEAIKIESQPKPKKAGALPEIWLDQASFSRMRENEIRQTLGRMGFQRAFNLVHPSEPGALKEQTAVAPLPARDAHFPGEPSLCIADWLARNPKIDARTLVAADGSVREKLVADCRLRWAETDDAAPHPDLDQIRAAIRKIEMGTP